MVKTICLLKRILLFSILTILTQIGGVIYLISIWLSGKIRFHFKLKTTLIFIVLYTLATLAIVPVFASIGGREKVVNTANIKPVNYFSILLNRNYVTPRWNAFLLKLSKDPQLKYRAIQVRYLNACFPFFNRFPLLPHLSHHDGKKIDLSLVYENDKGEIVNKSKSRSGYGIFEDPLENDFDQTEFCKKEGYFQYDYPKYLTFGTTNKHLHFSEKGTRTLLMTILENPEVGKVFIEPHLKQRLGIKDSRIRFQGCRAVRHDDHMHIQLK